MAKQDNNNSTGSNVTDLRRQRDEAEQSGDQARLTDLDRQIADAEGQSQGQGGDAGQR